MYCSLAEAWQPFADWKTRTAGATLCLWKADEVYQTAKVRTAAEMMLKVSPKTAGEISVTVSGPSLNVTQSAILVK